MKLYLDCCCFNRPYDDMSDNTMWLESEAILAIINKCEVAEWEFFSSDILFDEISQMGNIDKQKKVLLLYQLATQHISLTDEIVVRAREFEKLNAKAYDSLHLASAESVGVDVFLTTDKKLIKSAKRSDTKMIVKNPLIWLTEVLYEHEL